MKLQKTIIEFELTSVADGRVGMIDNAGNHYTLFVGDKISSVHQLNVSSETNLLARWRLREMVKALRGIGFRVAA